MVVRLTVLLGVICTFICCMYLIEIGDIDVFLNCKYNAWGKIWMAVWNCRLSNNPLNPTRPVLDMASAHYFDYFSSPYS